MIATKLHHFAALAALFVAAGTAHAQPASRDTDPAEPATVNVLVGFGPALRPQFPGDRGGTIGVFPQIEVWDSADPFPAEAPDEGRTFQLLSSDTGVDAGLVLAFAPRRRPSDVGLAVDKVGFGIEAGGFVSAYIAPPLRLRAELRRGIGSHNALVGDLRLDAIIRAPRDMVVATIGPRLRWGSGEYHRRFFGVTAAESARTSLATFAPSSGLYAVGVTAGAQVRLTPRWGLYAFAGYDRLVNDAARSPIVTNGGSRDQFSTGVALTYTFRIRRNSMMSAVSPPR